MTTTQGKSDFWQEHINARKNSNLSLAAYYQKHELKLSTFTYSRNKQSQSRHKLMPVSMLASDAPVEPALPGGILMQRPVSALEQTLPLIWRQLREQGWCYGSGNRYRLTCTWCRWKNALCKALP